MTGSDRQLPSAVVVGGELNGLGVCRSLARGNVPVYVLDHRRLHAAMWSRHAVPVKVPALYGPRFVEALHHLHADLGGRPMLIVTDEMSLLTISEFREDLRPLYRFRLPAHAAVTMLHDKAQFHEYAIAEGFPVPDSEIVREPADIRRIRRLGLPLVIKPADKRVVHAGGGLRLVVAGDWRTAEDAARQLLEQGAQAIVQECIKGPDASICFCLFYRAGGRIIAMFTGRKLASSPPGAGSTALCAHAGEIAGITEPLTEALLERVGYEGFGGVEYKWDAASGRFVIIEPTVGRTDWQEEIATLSGVNIPLAAYCHEYGLPLAHPAANGAAVWQASWVERIKVGRAAPAGAAIVDGYWRRDDPLPALIHYPKDVVVSMPAMLQGLARRSRKRFGQRASRLVRLIRPV